MARRLKESRERLVYSSRKAAKDKGRRRAVGLRILAVAPDGTAPLQLYLKIKLSGESQESIDSEFEDIVQGFLGMTSEDICA